TVPPFPTRRSSDLDGADARQGDQQRQLRGAKAARRERAVVGLRDGAGRAAHTEAHAVTGYLVERSRQTASRHIYVYIHIYMCRDKGPGGGGRLARRTVQR